MLLKLVRWVLPAAICLSAILLVVLSPDINGLEGAAMMIGAGLSVLLLNVLYRVGVEGDVERQREDLQRQFFDREGRWPSDAELDAEVRRG